MMRASDLARMLTSVPSPMDTTVYFEVPDADEACSGDEIAVNIFQYNNVTKEVVLKYDAPCFYEDEEI